MKKTYLIKMHNRNVCAFKLKIDAKNFCKRLKKIFGLNYTIEEINYYE